jgi:hypothetical protein
LFVTENSLHVFTLALRFIYYLYSIVNSDYQQR